MSYITDVPDVRDEVRHISQDVTGVVLTKHLGDVTVGQDPLKYYLDIRISEENVYYDSPAANWIVTTPVEDLE